MNRPEIKNIQTGLELKKWYWLKEELVEFCKLKQISYTGEKFTILERIANHLDNKVVKSKNSNSKKLKSKFDWNSEKLNLDTIITDSYKNSQSVRLFFQKYCGAKFHFSIPFIKFMKENCGKTLQDAVNEWKKLENQKKDKNFKSEIPEGNQYNKYIRDFFADNPDKSIQEARHFWKLKRSLPLGKHKYEKSDMKLKARK